MWEMARKCSLYRRSGLDWKLNYFLSMGTLPKHYSTNLVGVVLGSISCFTMPSQSDLFIFNLHILCCYQGTSIFLFIGCLYWWSGSWIQVLTPDWLMLIYQVNRSSGSSQNLLLYLEHYLFLEYLHSVAMFVFFYL